MSNQGIRNAILPLLLLGAGSRGDAADPKKAEAELAFNTARTYLESGRPELAANEFKKAIALNDKDYFAYKGLGLAYARLGKPGDAEKVLRKCLDINPDFADARNDLGAVLATQKRMEEARKEWLAAFASPFNPTPETTADNLATSYLEEQNYAEARRWFQTSIQKNTTYARAHIGLAATFTQLNQADAALSHLEQAAPATSNDAGVLLALGDAYFRAGRYKEARSTLDAAIKQDPASPAAKRAADMLRHFPK